MQLHFSLHELQALVDVLEQSEREFRSQGNERRRADCEGLLDRVACRDLGFGYDEMEDVLELLKAYKAKQGAFESSQKPTVIDTLIDRVTEACAMA